MIDFGKSLGRQVLHIGFTVKQKFKENTLNVKEEVLDLFLRLSIQVYHCMDVDRTISLNIKGNPFILFGKDISKHLDSE